MEYTRLFNNETQGSGTAVSQVFRADHNSSITAGLRFAGTLDGGTINIQVLDPSISVESASDSDWANTQDLITVPDYYHIDFTQVSIRLKATNLGASANFTVDFFPNKR